MEGIVSRVYHEGADGFVIARLSMGNNRSCTILGDLYGLEKGDTIKISEYRIENHKDYGEQVRVLSWSKAVPTTRQGVIEFFRSGLVKGVGDKRAHLIVNTLGEDALKRIKDEGPDVLKIIPGIGERLSQNIYDSVMEYQQLQGIVQDLSSFGMTFKMAMKAYKHFGPGVVDVVRLNPYKLIELNMVSFARADAIARNIGIKPCSHFRIKAAIDHVFAREAQKSGHCYLLLDELIHVVQDLLGEPEVDGDHIGEIVESLISGGDLKLEGLCLYGKSFYYAEKELAVALREIKGTQKDLAVVLGALMSCADRIGVKLSPEQQRAVEMAFGHGVFVLTGGPGTGKTQTVKAIIETAKVLGLERILLSAPTGRAAKVLSAVTGHEAQTLHRLLEMQPGGQPAYNASNPLRCDLLVVDEASMVDVFLARDLFVALPETAHVVLVGDRDQLPPVGPGNVLKDILAAGVPQVNLTRIYRQSESSAIVLNAHRVNGGVMPVLKGASDFFFIEKVEPAGVVDVIARSYRRLLEKGYSVQDIQVLSPMRKGETGVENLNRVLQAVYNPAVPSKGELVCGKTVFRVGDKVMQVKNDYSKQVFNGEVGIIERVGLIPVEDEDGEVLERDGLVVRFGDREVAYVRDELENLVLAYAVTVHKSQGCEYPVVILALTTQHYVMLARNLVYTAISRAKEMMVLVGTRKALAIGVKNDRVLARNTGLAGRLEGAFDEVYRDAAVF